MKWPTFFNLSDFQMATYLFFLGGPWWHLYLNFSDFPLCRERWIKITSTIKRKKPGDNGAPADAAPRPILAKREASGRRCYF